MFETISPYLATLLPTVGVAFLFYWIIKYMIEADRRERKALAAWRKEHERTDANRGRVASGPVTDEAGSDAAADTPSPGAPTDDADPRGNSRGNVPDEDPTA